MPSPLRRVTVVLLAYTAGSYVVLTLGGWLRRVLVLPPLFDVLLQTGLLVGLPVAAALAWSYPSLATGSDRGGARPDHDDRDDGSAP